VRNSHRTSGSGHEIDTLEIAYVGPPVPAALPTRSACRQHKTPVVVAVVLVVIAAAWCSAAAADLMFLLDAGGDRHLLHAVARLQDDQRPVLFRTETIQAGSGEGVVPPARQLAVPLALPPDVPFTADVSVQAITYAGSRARFRPVPLSRDEAADRTTVLLDFEPDEVGEPLRYVLLATRRPAPGERQRTLGPVQVPRGTVLRLAMGVEQEHVDDHPVTELEVEAVADGRTWPLLRHRLEPTRAKARWIPADISLAPVEGRTVSFRFRARAAHPGARSRRLYVLWGDPFMLASSALQPTTPNVIMISLDTLGARHLGAYGYPYPTSPHLDSFSEGGTLFEQAICHYPSTAASHMTLFTSLLPAAHGVRNLFDRLPATVQTLPEILRRAGYMTAAVTEDATLASGMGFVRGFHTYRENHRQYGATPGLARETFKQALRWLRTNPPEPFFLFLHTYQVHTPYRPPPNYLRLVRPDPLRADGPDPARRYDAEVRFLDRLLGYFLARLEESALRDRTVLILTSDHGEAFGQHGERGHGDALYESVMHVPLILRGPGVPARRRISTRVGLVDVMPTILEVVGIRPPSGIQGRSLLPFLRGDSPPALPLVAEVRGGLAPTPGPPEPDRRAVWLDNKKIIRDLRADRWEVFDLARDPEERRDLFATSGATITDAARVLEGYAGLEASPISDDRPAVVQPPTPEELEKLRALGYTR
jgi:arylsulfatase A-like enzyme